MKVLSVNCGSSTLKFRLYEMPEEKIITKGSFDRIGLDGSNYDILVNGEKVKEECELKNHGDAVQILIKELEEKKIISSLDEIVAVGHRVVHGGSKYSSSVVITDEVLKEIESLTDLAPLHNPASVTGIKAFMENIPNAKMVACFDTAFHQTMEEDTYLYSVPYSWYQEYGVRKYGFHGLSHQYISLKMREVLNKDGNLIICNIGNGASISAVKDGKCIDTSMGFTPNAGIMMGTRSGDIDYTMIGYMMKKLKKSYDEIDTILNKQSGLEGIALMSDLRDIDEAYVKKDEKVLLAISMYTRRIAEYIAKYALRLETVDAIIFTAGGGENDPIIRKEVLEKLSPLGVVIDNEKNDALMVRKGMEGLITKEDSKIPCYVYGTDEELMIARDSYHFVNLNA